MLRTSFTEDDLVILTCYPQPVCAKVLAVYADEDGDDRLDVQAYYEHEVDDELIMGLIATDCASPREAAHPAMAEEGGLCQWCAEPKEANLHAGLQAQRPPL